MQAPRTGATRTGRIDISSRSPLTAALGALASTSGVATSTKAAAPAPISAAASTTAARLEVRTKGPTTSPLYLPIGRLTAEEVQRFPWNQTSRQRLLSRQNRGQRAGNTAAPLAPCLRVGRSQRFAGGIGMRVVFLVSGPSARSAQIDSNSSDTRAAIRGRHSGSRRRRLSGIQYSRARVTGFRAPSLRSGPGMTRASATAPAGAGLCS
jgi:hypothetical protein